MKSRIYIILASIIIVLGVATYLFIIMEQTNQQSDPSNSWIAGQNMATSSFEAKGMVVTSPAVVNGKFVKLYTCEGGGARPTVSVTGVDPKAKSLLLTLDDIDAPGGIFHHWGRYIPWPNSPLIVPPLEVRIGAGASTDDIDAIDYAHNAPCPPPGEIHRYVFSLYSFDSDGSFMAKLNPKQLPLSKETIESLFASHIIQKAELIGTYKSSAYIPDQLP